MNELIRIIKKAALDAVEESKPAAIVFGSVISGEPLRIKINQKLILGHEFLLIPDHLKDMIYTSGDDVILLRSQGGQSYLILGKIGGD